MIDHIQEFLTGTREAPDHDRVLATVLFTDIVAATTHAERLGDRNWRGVRCALAIRDVVRTLGLEVRAGVHIGECELMGEKVGGIAVHTAARIMAKSRPGGVLVSRTVKDLVAGSGLVFEEAGRHALRSVAEEWDLYFAVSRPLAQHALVQSA